MSTANHRAGRTDWLERLSPDLREKISYDPEYRALVYILTSPPLASERLERFVGRGIDTEGLYRAYRTMSDGEQLLVSTGIDLFNGRLDYETEKFRRFSRSAIGMLDDGWYRVLLEAELLYRAPDYASPSAPHSVSGDTYDALRDRVRDYVRGLRGPDSR